MLIVLIILLAISPLLSLYVLAQSKTAWEEYQEAANLGQRCFYKRKLHQWTFWGILVTPFAGTWIGLILALCLWDWLDESIDSIVWLSLFFGMVSNLPLVYVGAGLFRLENISYPGRRWIVTVLYGILAMVLSIEGRSSQMG